MPADRHITRTEAVSALGRAGYGPSPADLDHLQTVGLSAWVEAQLHPDNGADPACGERLARLTLPIKYAASEKWPAMDETRPLSSLRQPIEALWPLITKRMEMDAAERRRPRDEVVAATILRAVHSRWQLREVMANFWHDHFNVDAYGSEQVAVALPSYDRDVIRHHALGNFRQFLEGVATSAAMLFYLSNRSSRAGSANENYARELFELHTLGRDAYFNDRYDRWRAVPGAVEGRPIGYIDQDVYEAARALTGWTVADGSTIDGRRKLAETGQFVYVESWHDGYQKRVLGTEFEPFRAPMADGRQVLDLVAFHPATARFLAAKLCRRLIGDKVSPATLAAAVRTWQAAAKDPDQIAQVLRVILSSPDFAAAQGGKVRRPLALAAAFARGVGIDLTPTEALANQIANAGQRLYGWSPPTGLPDERAFFISTNGMRQRWTLVWGLAENWWHTGTFEPSKRLDPAITTDRALESFLTALIGAPDPHVADAIRQGLDGPFDQPLLPLGAKPADIDRRLARLAALCGMAPAFQMA